MISNALATFVTKCSYDKLPHPVRESAKQCLLDWTGSAIRGSAEPPAHIYADIARAEGGNHRATAVPGRTKTSVSWAAQINAAASHTVEMDDLHPASVLHPAAPIISAALAVGESVDATGMQLIEAIVAGYEVGIRAGEAVGRSHYTMWHTTATCGTFGAAAASAKLLNLRADQIVHALGSAGTQAAGLWQFLEDGAMSKQLHPAHAASAGILSAELANRDFTAATKIFEGPKGFLAAMSSDANVGLLTEGLGESFRISTNSFKKHASCRHTHSSIDSTLILRNERKLRAENLGRLEVRVYPAAFDLLNGVQPTTAYAAKFCLPFTVAMALNRGRVALDEFEDLSADDLRTTMSRIVVVRDESLGRDYPEKWPARVTATTESGVLLSAEVDYPRGDSRNPLNLGELQDKFRTLTEHILSPEQREHVIHVAANLEKYQCKDIWP